MQKKYLESKKWIVTNLYGSMSNKVGDNLNQIKSIKLCGSIHSKLIAMDVALLHKGNILYYPSHYPLF